MIYELARDANFYLHSSIILYDGVPSYVHQVDENFMAMASRLDNQQAVEFHVNKDERVDLKPMPLGFIQHKGRALFVSRKPKRSWRQGLTKNNLSGEAPWEVVCSPALTQVVENKYPRFELCVESVGNRLCESAAFHRMFRVFNNDDIIHLQYKNTLIGKIERGEPVLCEEFAYLNETIREAIQ